MKIAGDRFAGQAVMVVGGAGFVGSNLVRQLLADGVAKVDVVDNFLSAEPANLPDDSRVVLHACSITDDLFLNSLSDRFDYIWHLATFHGNQSSIFDPYADHENNTLTSLKLFNTIRSYKRLKKVVYSGAGCAVAEKTFQKAEATEESDLIAIDGDSPYSLSKIFGEFYAKYFFKQYGCPIVRARFQNVYGPCEILGAGRWRGTPATIWRNVTPTFIWKALLGEPLTVENDGIATRDFIYVADVVEGLIALALKGEPPEAYNIATGQETSIISLANLINSLCKNKAPILNLPRRTWDNSGKRFGSTEKSKIKLNFEASVGIEQGLSKTIEWTIANRELISRCIDKHQIHLSSTIAPKSQT